MSVLDEHIARSPGGPREQPRRAGETASPWSANYRLVRYADDWCLVINGTKADAEALREEIAEVLSTMGLRLSPEKTLITHIDEGLDFLGWRIQRHRKRGTNRTTSTPTRRRRPCAAVMAKVKTICRQVGVNQPLDALLVGSIRRCGAGAPTSGPGPRR